jgi:prophage regulatory protein
MPKVLLRLPVVIARTGLTTTEIYEAQKLGTFPASVPLGERTVGWVESEIDEWIAQRIAQRDAQSLEHARKERRRKGGPGRGHRAPLKNSPIVAETTDL